MAGGCQKKYNMEGKIIITTLASILFLIFATSIWCTYHIKKNEYWIIKEITQNENYVTYIAESPNSEWHQSSTKLRFVDDAGKFNIGDTIIIVKK